MTEKLKSKLSVLDCTLRDGGYINNWNFSQSQVHKIIDSLEKSDIDIIELGYLDNKKGAGENSTRFNSVSSVDSVLSSVSNNHTIVVMIDLFAFNEQDVKKHYDNLLKYKNNNLDKVEKIACWYKENFFVEPTEENIVRAFELN